MPAVRRALVLAIAAVVVAPGAARAATVTLAKLGDFSAPIYVTAPLGDTSRVFVVEQEGTIKAIRNGKTLAKPFLDISGEVDTSDVERGLLSMAFSPDYRESGLFYVYYTARGSGQINHRGRAPRRSADEPLDKPDPVAARAPLAHDTRTASTATTTAASCTSGPTDDALRRRRRRRWASATPATAAAKTAPPCSARSCRIGAQRSGSEAIGDRRRTSSCASVRPPAPSRRSSPYGLRDPVALLATTATAAISSSATWARTRYEEVDYAAPPGDGAGRQPTAGRPTRAPAPIPVRRGPAGSAPGAVQPVVELPARQPGVLDHRRLRGARSRPCPRSPARYLYGDNCTGDISGATLPTGTPRALGLNVPGVSSFGEDGCGRVYAASLSGPVYRFASSGACAGPAPFVGRLPAGVTAGPAAAGPDGRAPAFTLLRAAARQHALRTGFVAVRVRCDELCAVSAGGRVLIARSAHAAAATVLRTRTARATLVAGARTMLRLKLSKATRRAIKRSLARPGRRATVRITVRAVDRADNARTATRRVRIVR